MNVPENPHQKRNVPAARQNVAKDLLQQADDELPKMSENEARILVRWLFPQYPANVLNAIKDLHSYLHQLERNERC